MSRTMDADGRPGDGTDRPLTSRNELDRSANDCLPNSPEPVKRRGEALSEMNALVMGDGMRGG